MSTAIALEVDVDCLEQPVHCADVPVCSRTQQLLRTEIDFIDNREFRLDATLGSEAEAAASEDRAGLSVPADMPAHLARLCEANLLTAEQERQLFRCMNYLKFRANALRCQLDPAFPDVATLEQIEQMLDQARRIRDRLIRANMRLAISVVKKFVTPQRSFDDMLSDGIFSLMQAVDKFDYSRGFRFSTYAYRAISHNACRQIGQQQKEAARLVNCDDEGYELETQVNDSSLNERTWGLLRGALTNLMGRLDRREQFIIRGRYALGRHRKVKTFQSLADKLGLSKERVRQLEQRAVAKLRSWSDDLQVLA